MNQRASKGGDREGTDYAGPRITQRHGPTTQRTLIDADTGRHKQANVYLSQVIQHGEL